MSYGRRPVRLKVRTHPFAAAFFAVAGLACTEVPAPATPAAAAATAQASGTPAPAVTNAKFGPAEGFELGAIPAVPPLATADVTLVDLDLELLRKLKAARKLDRDDAAEPSAKADAWSAVAAHGARADGQPGDHPFAPAAAERAKLWTDVAEARERRAANLETLRTKFKADRASLTKMLEGADDAKRRSLEDAFVAAYVPYEEHVASVETTTSEPAAPTKPAPAAKYVSPLFAPTALPLVQRQYVYLKGDFGAFAQSFSVDTSDELLGGDKRPEFDLSGFYAGGQIGVNVAETGDLAIGLLASGRYHVTTSLPTTTFESGNNGSEILAPADADRTGAFMVAGGARLAGNVTERIGMNLGLTGGYVQFLAPPEVPGCGEDEVPWDPALRGFQGEIFVGFEFYPLALLSFGVSGRVGFGHVEGQWCVPGSALSSENDTPATPLDVSADSFSVGAQGEIGFHF